MSKKMTAAEVVTHVLSTYVHADEHLPVDVADMLAACSASSKVAVMSEYRQLADQQAGSCGSATIAIPAAH